MLESIQRLEKCQLAACVLSSLANFFLFVATLTPAWQVAEDTDVNRYVQSGLWLYCPGAAQCWYIFSDNLINYYEKVDVCRFLLIGDCRKKLLRTPYFFGWHYAVLILNIIIMCLISLSIVTTLIAYYKKERRRVATILCDIFIFFSAILLGISLIIFVVNAEMLESKYLIGVKNTFEKNYGYSLYLAATAFLILVFAMLPAIMMTTFTFFTNDNGVSFPRHEIPGNYSSDQYYQDQPYRVKEDFVVPSSFSKKDMYRQEAVNVQGQTSFRSSTPLSQISVLNAQHGEYIPPSQSPNGDFQPTTRHFYSY